MPRTAILMMVGNRRKETDWLGRDINAQHHTDGTTFLHRIIGGEYEGELDSEESRLDDVSAIIAIGADVNIQDNEGRSPLHVRSTRVIQR
jgi:ankyrin repeat protein